MYSTGWCIAVRTEMSSRTNILSLVCMRLEFDKRIKIDAMSCWLKGLIFKSSLACHSQALFIVSGNFKILAMTPITQKKKQQKSYCYWLILYESRVCRNKKRKAINWSSGAWMQQLIFVNLLETWESFAEFLSKACGTVTTVCRLPQL